MRAMKCDRCGKIYEEHKGMTVDTELARIYLKNRKTYDLCPDCMKEQAKKQMEDYCKNDSNALCAAYNNRYSKGFSEGREEEKKEVMLLTDHCIGKCDILESVLHMEGDKND